MNPEAIRHIPASLGQKLHHNHMELLGIADTMKLAFACNQLKQSRQDAWQQMLYQTRLDDLLQDNGPLTVPPILMQDGWAIGERDSLIRRLVLQKDLLLEPS